MICYNVTKYFISWLLNQYKWCFMKVLCYAQTQLLNDKNISGKNSYIFHVRWCIIWSIINEDDNHISGPISKFTQSRNFSPFDGQLYIFVITAYKNAYIPILMKLGKIFSFCFYSNTPFDRKMLSIHFSCHT